MQHQTCRRDAKQMTLRKEQQHRGRSTLYLFYFSKGLFQHLRPSVEGKKVPNLFSGSHSQLSLLNLPPLSRGSTLVSEHRAATLPRGREPSGAGSLQPQETVRPAEPRGGGASGRA